MTTMPSIRSRPGEPEGRLPPADGSPGRSGPGMPEAVRAGPGAVTSSSRGRLDEIAERHPIPDWRLPALLIAALLTAGGGWAAVARLDEVVVAEGEVVPRGQVKTVQHLEGGIIEELMVAEGDRVGEGQPLLALDLASTGINVEALQAQLDGLELRRARLMAEANDTIPDYPPGSGERRPTVLAAEQRIFEDRKAELESATTRAREQVRQRRLQVTELEARLAGLESSLRPAEERFALSESLLEDELTPRMEHLQIERDLEELRSGITQTRAALPRSRAALAEAVEREREAVLAFRRNASEELAETEVDVVRRQELLNTARDQELRTIIAAPLEGFVQNMRYHTVGGVIRPGEPIMEIVPAYDKLLIEARVDPRDIGHIEVGLPATVKVSTYDYIRYGGLDGEITHIAADANTDRMGRHWFRVVVETDRTALGESGNLPITPGMIATIDVHTGTRSVLEYLVGPVLRMRHEAFRER